MVTNNQQVIEKRHNPRVHFRARVILATTPDFESLWVGVIEDISRDGLKVKVSRNFGGSVQRCNKVNFEILKDYFNLEGEGEIVWISPNKDTAGIKFGQLNEKDRKTLEQFLRSYSQSD